MGDGTEIRKRKGPSPNIALQQRLPVYQLVYTPKCVTLTFIVFGILLIVIGLICVSFEATVKAWPPSGPYTYFDRSMYDPAEAAKGGVAKVCPCAPGDSCPQQGRGPVAPCLVQFTIREDISGPVYFYYALTKVYQNHQRLSDYRRNSVEMARGQGLETIAADAGFPNCWPFEKYTEVIGGKEEQIFYYPCGLMSRSLFNDTFTLKRKDTGEVVEWTSKGIAYASSGGTTGKNVAASIQWHKDNCYRLGGSDFNTSGYDESLRYMAEPGGGNKKGRFHCWHNVSDEAYQVWLRPAGRPNFWKLHRRLPNGLKKGDYHLEIGVNYPVYNFSGTKGFYFTNATPMGGSRPFLSALYLSIGAMLIAAALAFTVLHIAKPGPLTKPQVKYAPVTVKPPKEGALKRQMSVGLAAAAVGGKSKAAEGVDTKRHCIFPASARPEHNFESNFVKTSRYTVVTFIPLNLFIQFQRIANTYFLAVAILASTPLSPLSGATFWMPLIFVLSVSALKDASEDYSKHKSDAEENARKTWVFDEHSKQKLEEQFIIVPWRDVHVGEIVMVTTADDDTVPMIPCDLVLLASSAVDGTAFLETMNLDGETNLKLREALEATHKDLVQEGVASDGNASAEIVPAKVAALKVTVTCNEPDNLLYEFSAKMQYKGEDLPLNGGAGCGQFLQRSAKLRNSKFVVGLSVYTGKETKIQMNMSDPPIKLSNIEKRLNTYIFGIFFTLFSLCTIGAIANSINMSSPLFVDAWYLDPSSPRGTYLPGNAGLAGVYSFFSTLVLLSLLVPISLYVSIEMVKLFLSILISSDREMYAVQEDQATLARSLGLCEELGQVNYIFSDKTGTLTQNLMEFKKCSIGGVEYGRGFCEVERAIARRQGRLLPDDPLPPPGLDEGFNFVDERLLFANWQNPSNAEDTSLVEDFFVNMSVNHNVQIEYLKDGQHVYQAESPDEGAFVAAARNCGFFFCKREIKDVLVKVAACGAAVGQGPTRTYSIKQFNPFDNNRKRTSLIVKAHNGDLILLVKGADACVMPFIDEGACPYFKTTQSHIDKFGDQGLRTLVFAGRKLDPGKYEEWNKLYKKAALLPDGREAALRQLASQIEEDHSKDGCESVIFDSSTPHTKSLRLHGVTALEDRLQENVGHCISQLAKAMIKIWVLTGDKLETAINIGYATALLSTDMEPLIRMSTDEITQPAPGWEAKAAAAELRLDDLLTACKAKELPLVQQAAEKGKRFDTIKPLCEMILGKCAELSRESDTTVAVELAVLESKVRDALIKERVRSKILEFKDTTSKERAGGYALVIDGPCLRAAVSEECKMDFLEAAIRCKAVVCCRVTPAQKAAVTLLVKDNMPGQITLAIGDGANDVAMIQAAHLGVGIRGKEGQQAVLASDYALPRFAYLERLLLVHGRWSYNRIGTMVCYFFYKNIIFGLTLFWFNIWNGFSSQPLYDEGYQSLYNLAFTSFPVIIFAVLDRDVEAYVVQAHPELYSVGQTNQRFTGSRFAVFIFGAISHSLTLFYISIELLDTNVSNELGQESDFWSAGTSILGNLIITVTCVISLHTRSWHFSHVFIMLASVGVWFLFLVLYHSLTPGQLGSMDTDDNVYNVIFELGVNVLHHLTTLIVVVMNCAPVLAYMFIKEHYFPQIDDYYRRVCHSPELYPHETGVEDHDKAAALRVTVVTPPGGGGGGGGGGLSAGVGDELVDATPRSSVGRGAARPDETFAGGPLQTPLTPWLNKYNTGSLPRYVVSKSAEDPRNHDHGAGILERN